MAIPDDRRRRRSPTPSELAAWRLFIETSERVRGVVASRLQEDSGLSQGDYAVLLALTEHPEHRLRSSQLAEDIGWERSRLSHHLGRMERRGLLTREQASDDSRGAEVVLAAPGAEAFRSATAPHFRAVQETFVAGLSSDQLAAVQEAMLALRAHLASRD
ncbi:MarR family winged helix-turn-helix transcriptional regulator [Rathayibacter sp. VKM Ac-2754]|uniref:MarR family winged helix-turn-helix transcriptional regulator n=1 Tax=Rathayibacter sp. VKM Ac-2754 TaxID=2609251 RepID=UPI00135BD377|nr:MarR family transcriptional regulator [Rathayibacter sp. VKM Ac-2754]MWV60320.1 MarR family transcriptional regulator [Rathayibacter sp. VKM Ac-2754]